MTPAMHAALIVPLVLHVAGGGVAIIAGAAAMAGRKGGKWHRTAGTVFFASMLVATAAATLMAAIIPQRGNLVGGVFAFYLVSTAWLTVRRRPPASPPYAFRLNAAAASLGAAAFLLAGSLGLEAATAPVSRPDAAAPMLFIFGGLAAMAVAFDVRVLRLGGLNGTPRLARHVWRMSTSLFIASGSFFLGQQKVMPVSVQGSPWLFVPALAPLAVMAFWLVRLRLSGSWRLRPIPS